MSDTIPAFVVDELQRWCLHCNDVFGDDCGEPECRPALTPGDFLWRICSRCRGDGVLRGYPGVYFESDFAEDPDLYEDYMAHRRACEDCGGSGKVRTLTDEALDRPIVTEWVSDYYQSEHISAMERRMGA